MGGDRVRSPAVVIAQRDVRVVGRPLRARGEEIEALPPQLLHLRDGRILSVRPCCRAIRGALGSPTTFLLPGLSDPHLHLVGMAAETLGTSFAGDHPKDLAGLEQRLGVFSKHGGWLRISGFEETKLAEGRFPTRRELDAWVPSRPLRIRHATRHASLFNTAAFQRLEQAGILPTVPAESLLVGQEIRVADLLPRVAESEIVAALRLVGEELLSHGITSLDEVTASNDADRVALLERAALPQRIRVWLAPGADRKVAQAAARRVEIAGIKLLPPDAEAAASSDFAADLAAARLAGLPVAIHAVEADAIAAVLGAIEKAPPRAPGGPLGLDRIEHASLCPPTLVDRIAAAGVAVVTQPGFLVVRGERYRREVEVPLHGWLYPVASWLRAGIPVAFSSDAPVGTPAPSTSFAGACERGAPSGVPLGPEEAISAGAAFAAQYLSAARIRGEPSPPEWTQPGARAAFSLLASDPRESRFRNLRVSCVVLPDRQEAA